MNALLEINNTTTTNKREQQYYLAKKFVRAAVKMQEENRLSFPVTAFLYETPFKADVFVDGDSLMEHFFQVMEEAQLSNDEKRQLIHMVKICKQDEIARECLERGYEPTPKGCAFSVCVY